MRIKGIVPLLLVICALAGFFSGCDNDNRRAKVKWDLYDESTRNLILFAYSLNDEDIIPLENLTGLISLSLERNQISDLTPFANLTNLTELYLSDNQISDLSPLANLSDLNKLYLDGNKINDLTPLADLENLTILYLGNNQISDLTPLAGLEKLTVLSLSDNRISALTPLTNLENLAYLSISNNCITDWSSVAHVLDVEGNPDNAVPFTIDTDRLKTGQIFFVSFDETQSIPERWKTEVSDASLVRLICTRVDSSANTSNMPGSPGEERVFYFEALRPGECTIDMYLLPFGSDDIAQYSQKSSYTFVIER